MLSSTRISDFFRYLPYQEYNIYLYDDIPSNQKLITEKLYQDLNSVKQFLSKKSICNITSLDCLANSIHALIDRYQDEMNSNKASFIYFALSIMWDYQMGVLMSSRKLYEAYKHFITQLRQFASKANTGVSHDDWLRLFYYMAAAQNTKDPIPTLDYVVGELVFEDIIIHKKFIPCVNQTGTVNFQDILYILSHNAVPVGISLDLPHKVHHGIYNLGISKLVTMLHDVRHADENFKGDPDLYDAMIAKSKEVLLQNNPKAQYLFFILIHEMTPLDELDIEIFLMRLNELSPCIGSFLDYLTDSYNDDIIYEYITKNDITQLEYDDAKDIHTKILLHGLSESIDLKFPLRELGYFIPKFKQHNSSLIRANSFIFLAVINLLLDVIAIQPEFYQDLGLFIGDDEKHMILRKLSEHTAAINTQKYAYSESLKAKWTDMLNIVENKLELITAKEQSRKENTLY